MFRLKSFLNCFTDTQYNIFSNNLHRVDGNIVACVISFISEEFKTFVMRNFIGINRITEKIKIIRATFDYPSDIIS